jgi:hypothetical protein
MRGFATTPKAEEMRAYRRRLAAEGQQEIIAALPRETIAYLDQFKQCRGLRNRSEALRQLIEHGREATQQ